MGTGPTSSTFLGTKRHEWKAAHGFRKFYKSRTEQVMKPINVEITMGHDIGVSASYYKPIEQEVLQDYLKAIDILTISTNKMVLQKQMLELKEKTKDSELLIESKLQQKDSELLEWKKRYLKDVKGLIKQMNAMKEFQKETQNEMAELKKYRLNHMNIAFSP
jgi:hypothetical protein